VRLLDLFCGAGGCAWGYRMAGFEIVGVDIEPQPNYPFEFWQADALKVLPGLAARTGEIPVFDAIHASPPCQSYSDKMKHLAKPQPMLIEPVRELLIETGLPWVIENVVGAPLPTQDTLDGRYGVELCGTMFGLPVYRHRLFECSFPIAPPSGCSHRGHAMNPHNQRGRNRIYRDIGRQDPERPWLEAMGVGWMERYEGREAVPPAFTAYLGRFLAMEVRKRACQEAAA
jgi:DNA (cytosine-5)-methyltransferase 1